MDSIAEKTSDEKTLSLLGAGPLETLLGSEKGAEYVEEIITRARQHKNWRFALGNVWTNGFANRQVAQRVEESIKLFSPRQDPKGIVQLPHIDQPKPNLASFRPSQLSQLQG